jgi:metalloprotease ARX1
MPPMQLAIHQDDADILLKERNVLNDSILDKYRTAGQITQTTLNYLVQLINQSYHLGNGETVISVPELCLLGDSFMTKLLAKLYNSNVREKGISTPTSIEVNELISGFSPEIDDENGASYVFKAGDVVTISCGVHIDGYTSNVCHTIVIYPHGVEVDQTIKPEGPLLGGKADAICATHIAVETVVALLGLALTPEKIPGSLATNNGGSSSINGSQIRAIVDSIADSFNCAIVPGSKIRRIRRFLAGQAEGIVAEKDFKGVVWDESHQEQTLLSKSVGGCELIVSNKTTTTSSSSSSAVPSDEFTVQPGEVYQIDIKMVSLSECKEAGIVTLQEVDQFSGKNNKDDFNSKPTIYIRDYAVNHQLRLKTSRRLLGEVDKKFTVFPFKLSHVCPQFPLQDETEETLKQVKSQLKTWKLGLAELHNRHLVKAKPIQITKFISLEKILTSTTTTGKHGIDMSKPVLPGMEVPLPQLNVTSLKLNSLLKYGESIANVREQTTVVLNDANNEVIRLTGGSKSAVPSWVHSQYKLKGQFLEGIEQLVQLTKDKRFGIKIKEINGYKLGSSTNEMQLD